MKAYIYFIFISFFLYSSTLAQNDQKIQNRISEKKSMPNSSQTAGDQVNIKDGSGNSLISIVDEGNGAGSILLPSITTVGSGSAVNKLINASGTLYWNGSEVGLGTSPWSKSGSYIYPATLTDKVGLGTNSPGANLDIRGSNTATGVTLNLGNSDRSHRLDFSSGDDSHTPAVIWQDGDQLNFGSGTGSSYNRLMQIESNGNIGIGIFTTSDAKLDVNGQVKIRGGSPGAGKILTSDANGLATWEDNTVSAFNATLNSTISLTGYTESQIVSFTKSFDEGNDFNASTGVFTVPATGVYQFSIKALYTSTSSLSNIKTWTIIKKNGTQFQRFDYLINSIGTTSIANPSSFISILIYAQAGDEITFFMEVYNSTSAISIYGNGSTSSTNISGFKVH